MGGKGSKGQGRKQGFNRDGQEENYKTFLRIEFSGSSLAFLTLYFILVLLFHRYLSTNAFIIASHPALSSAFMTHTHTNTHNNDPFLGPCKTKDLCARR